LLSDLQSLLREVEESERGLQRILQAFNSGRKLPFSPLFKLSEEFQGLIF